MKKQRSILQKSALFFAVISFILTVVCGVLFYTRVDGTGFDNPISASLLASIFFFGFVGFTLSFIGKSDLPSFKVEDTGEEK